MNQLAVIKRSSASLSNRLSLELASLVWTSTLRKQFMVTAPVIGGCLFGASFLLASVPARQPPAKAPSIKIAREEFTPPMVRLLEDMSRASKTASAATIPQNASLTGPIAAPFVFANLGGDRERALTCLATAGWYEAGNDPAGQRAVMQVVLNRVRHPSFPKSVCAVVFQGAERRTGCQFSFTCDGSMTRRLPSTEAWARARALAEAALGGMVDPDVRQATHFHADYVNPWWASKLDPIAKIGAHIFYRWGGARGALGSANLTLTREAFPALANANNAYVAPKGQQRPAGGDLVAEDDPSKVSAASLVNTVRTPKAAAPAALAAPAPASPRNLFLRVDQSGPNGRWALSAMGLCPASGSCRVIALGDGAVSGSGADYQASGRPLFLFARDAAGMQVALWDCDRAPRPRADQCLPSGAELDALLD